MILILRKTFDILKSVTAQLLIIKISATTIDVEICSFFLLGQAFFQTLQLLNYSNRRQLCIHCHMYTTDNTHSWLTMYSTIIFFLWIINRSIIAYATNSWYATTPTPSLATRQLLVLVAAFYVACKLCFLSVPVTGAVTMCVYVIYVGWQGVRGIT